VSDKSNSDVIHSFNVSPELQALQDIFECHQCGKCCRIGGNPLLSDADVCRIAVNLGCSPVDRQRIPIEPCEVHGADYRIVLTSPCFYQDKMTGLCLINDFKPQNCLEWPFISFAKGMCDFEHILVCPQAKKLLKEFLGVCNQEK